MSIRDIEIGDLIGKGIWILMAAAFLYVLIWTKPEQKALNRLERTRDSLQRISEDLGDHEAVDHLESAEAEIDAAMETLREGP